MKNRFFGLVSITCCIVAGLGNLSSAIIEQAFDREPYIFDKVMGNSGPLLNNNQVDKQVKKSRDLSC